MKIRKEDIQRRLDYLNQLTGSPLEEFHTIGAIEIPNVGHYKTHGSSYALGIYRTRSADGSMSEIIEYQEPHELLPLLNAFIAGIETQQVNDRPERLESVGALIDSNGWLMAATCDRYGESIEPGDYARPGEENRERVHITNASEEWIGELSYADWNRVSRWFRSSEQITLDQRRNQRLLNVDTKPVELFSTFIDTIAEPYAGTMTREDDDEG